MRANQTSPYLKRIALLILLALSTGVPVSAQTHDGAEANFRTLMPGMTVWVTDSSGREEKTQIVAVAGDSLTTAAGAEVRRLRTTDVTRVRVRHSDSLINGALIGAGAAVASGLLLCRLTESWENCRDDVGPMLGIGAMGAGIGLGLDALIRGRRTIYEAPQGATRLNLAPIIASDAQGLNVSFSF